MFYKSHDLCLALINLDWAELDSIDSLSLPTSLSHL